MFDRRTCGVSRHLLGDEFQRIPQRNFGFAVLMADIPVATFRRRQTLSGDITLPSGCTIMNAALKTYALAKTPDEVVSAAPINDFMNVRPR